MPFFIFLVALLLALSGCERQRESAIIPAEGEAAKPAFGDTIIMGSIGEPSVLIPALSSDSASSEINGLVYNGLVRYDKNLEIEPVLAEAWEISEDKLTITFHLRKGVKWHDGAPFTSADVLFTYRTMIDPKTPTAYAEDFLQVKTAEAPDPYTFRVTYDKPLATALISWGFGMLPKHLLDGKDITKSPLTRHPVGTGPYKFVEWRVGEKVVVESNPDYWEGQPYIHRVVYRIIPDLSTMFLELQSGGLDYMGLTPLQYSRQTDTPAFKRRFNKYRYPAFAYTYLGFNLRRPMFQDKRVRQALAYAIDKREIIDGVLLGLGQIANGPYKPGTWVHNSEANTYPYDPQKAKALLAEAGWTDSNNDGIVDRNGQPLSFLIMTNQGNDQRTKSGEIIQRRFREIGVDVKLRVMEWASFLKEFVKPGNFDAIILGWTISIDPDAYDIWHSTKTKPDELNFIGFNNAEVDDLLERGRRSFDQEERRKIYGRLQEILADEQPYVFLYVPDSLPVVASRFRGIEPAPAGISYNFHKWYVPQSEQKFTR